MHLTRWLGGEGGDVDNENILKFNKNFEGKLL